MKRLLGVGLLLVVLVAVGCQQGTVAETASLEMEPEAAEADTMYFDEPSLEPAEDYSYTGGRTHMVVKDDTFYSLAEKYYGDGKQWKRIQEANPGVIPEKLPIGKKLIIP